MANAIKWSALGTYTTAIAGAATAPTLKNLANNTGKLGNAIDNATSGRDIYSEWELYVRCASAPTGNPFVDLYFIESADGTNYEDPGSSDSPVPAKMPVITFPIRLVATQQRIVIPRLILPPFKFKPMIWNNTGQAFTNTDNENVLSYRTYNEEIQ